MISNPQAADAIENAGRQPASVYRESVLNTTLLPGADHCGELAREPLEALAYFLMDERAPLLHDGI